jgi:predicted GIY-YIG superfamily endonuclease
VGERLPGPVCVYLGHTRDSAAGISPRARYSPPVPTGLVVGPQGAVLERLQASPTPLGSSARAPFTSSISESHLADFFSTALDGERRGSAGIFMSLLPFTVIFVNAVPAAPGIYVVYMNGAAFYVGRSRVDIRRRLKSHLKGNGNQKIARAPRHTLQFEYCEMDSSEQAESQLMKQLKTGGLGNMRLETDPAEWEFPCRECDCRNYQDHENPDGGYPTVDQVVAGTATCRCGHPYANHE